MTEKYAIIEDGEVINVILAETEHAANQGWVSCPDHVNPGWSYDGSEFTAPDAPPPYQSAAHAKRVVNNWIDRLLSQVTAGYPDHEVQSWPVKGPAAIAVLAGDATPEQTAMIQDEADELGVLLTDLAGTIKTKAVHLQTVSAVASAMRQKVFAQLDAATTPTELAAIVETGLQDATAKANELGLSPP